MQKLFIDDGMKQYQLTEGGALLRFNPKDQNLYARFVESVETIKAAEMEMAGKLHAVDRNAKNAGERTLKILRQTDIRMKNILNQVFGNDNDFDAILRGVNLMAVGDNGKRVIENVMDALLPVMEAGAKACVQEEVQEAKDNREARRANQ